MWEKYRKNLKLRCLNSLYVTTKDSTVRFDRKYRNDYRQMNEIGNDSLSKILEVDVNT